jgi:hypothetical protein
MDTNSILNPDGQVELASGTTATVKELAWKRALVFFEMLEDQVKGMLDDQGKFKFDTTTIFSAIKGNAPLVEWIAKECAGIDEAGIAKLTLGDMAKIVTKALEINLRSVADEIKNVRSRFDALAAAGGATPGKSNLTPPNSAT